MPPNLEAVSSTVLEHLSPREVLQIINYRPDTIQTSDNSVKAFCPIHQELVFRTLIIDPDSKQFRCSYSLCQGNTGGDLIDLYAFAKKIDRARALQELISHLPISIDWEGIAPAEPEAEAEAEEAEETAEVSEEPIEAEEPAEPMATDEVLQEPEAPPAPPKPEVKPEPKAAPKAAGRKPARPKVPAPPSKKSALEEAAELMQAEEWDRAEAAYGEILAVDEKNLRALVGRARCMEKLGQTEALSTLHTLIIERALECEEIPTALTFFRRLCETPVPITEILRVLEMLIGPARSATRGISPLVEAIIGRAERCEMEEDFASALRLYRALQPVAMSEIDVTGYITNLLCQMGETDQAIEIHEERLAEALEARDLTEALECHRAMIDLDPTRVDFRQAFIETAIEDGLSPHLFREVLTIIDAWIEGSEYGLAREALDLLAHYLPSEIAIHQRLWRIAQDQGDNQTSRSAAIKLADLCRQAGKPMESIVYLESLPRDTSTPDLTEMLAQCQFEAGQIEQAVETLVGLARHCDASGAWASSEALYSRLATWQPHESRWRAKQAKCKQQIGDTKGALALYEQSGMDFLTTGRSEEAAEVWTEALAIDPAAVEIAQLQYQLLGNLGREEDAKRLLNSTVNYLKLNRGPQQAAEFLSTALGSEELSAETSLLLADLWAQGENTQETISVLRRGLTTAKAEGDIEAQVRLAQRWLSHDQSNTEAMEILAQHGDSASKITDRRRVLRQLGDTLMANSNWDQATEVLKQLMELEPDEARHPEKLIECHIQRGDNDAANRLRFHLAETHFANERWQQCEAALRPLLEAEKVEQVIQHVAFHCFLNLDRAAEAEALAGSLVAQAEEEGDLDTAITITEQMLSVRADNPEWLERLVDFHDRGENRQGALTAARRLLVAARGAENHDLMRKAADHLRSLAHDDREIMTDVIRTLEALGDIDAVVKERLHLAKLHSGAGEVTNADGIYRSLLESNPDQAEARDGLLDLLLTRDNAEAAVNLCWDRAQDLLEAERVQDAIEVLERLLDIDGEHIDARRQLADLLRSQLRNDEAVQHLAKLAETQTDNGDHSDAVVTWQEVVDLRPEVVPYQQALITAQLSSGGGATMQQNVERLMAALIARSDPREALESLDRFESFDPSLPLWHRWRGEILTGMGETADALAAFRKFSLMVDKHVSARAGRDMSAGVEDEAPAIAGGSLVPDYTFDRFIIGDRNNFAFATCRAVADNPAKAYNPLFLYSDVGLGKTHLVNAIGNHIHQQHPRLRILYTSVEDFVTELVESIQRNQVNEFRNRHRRIDVLLIDDVQFLASKERAQEEFFHLFNTLYQAGKQIVVTSDRPPREMTYLEKRLRSRFGAGVIVDIQPPDFETRLAIVRQVASGESGGSLPSEVIDLLAERCSSNVRELKGALTQLIALSSAKTDPITVEEATAVLDSILESVG